MAIKLKALRPCYVAGQRREYQAGDEFSVVNEKEASRLERSRRAERAGATAVTQEDRLKAVPTAPPPTTEPAELPDAPPFPEPETEPEVTRPSRRYRRRDLKAEE
jgi:hypothetical protein